MLIFKIYGFLELYFTFCSNILKLRKKYFTGSSGCDFWNNNLLLVFNKCKTKHKWNFYTQSNINSMFHVLEMEQTQC